MRGDRFSCRAQPPSAHTRGGRQSQGKKQAKERSISLTTVAGKPFVLWSAQPKVCVRPHTLTAVGPEQKKAGADRVVPKDRGKEKGDETRTGLGKKVVPETEPPDSAFLALFGPARGLAVFSLSLPWTAANHYVFASKRAFGNQR